MPIALHWLGFPDIEVSPREARQGRQLLQNVVCQSVLHIFLLFSWDGLSHYLFLFSVPFWKRKQLAAHSPVPWKMAVLMKKIEASYLSIYIGFLQACQVFQLWKEHSSFNTFRLCGDSLGISEINSLNLLLFQTFILSTIFCVQAFPLHLTHHPQSCFRYAAVLWSTLTSY